MADCYPPDFVGPLPPGGYYCTPAVPSFFGSLNAILQQGASTAAQIKNALNQYQGKSIPPPAVPMTSTASSTIVLLFGALLVALVIWLVVREL